MYTPQPRIRLPPAQYAALAWKVLKRDGFKCRKCPRRDSLHVHHIVFRSRGGSDTMENLMTVCNTCHDRIHRGA